jgi:hypothetical protein
MKKLVVSLLFLAFCILLIHVSSLRLHDWYETGQLLADTAPINVRSVDYNALLGQLSK